MPSHSNKSNRFSIGIMPVSSVILLGHSHIAYVTSKEENLRQNAEMIMKVPENELQNISIVKFNAQSQKIYKATLGPAKPIFSGRFNVA